MKRFSLGWPLLVGMALTVAGCTAEGGKCPGCRCSRETCPAPAGTAERCDGTWVPLFNGRDLTGWQAEGQADWKVQDGVLIGTQGPGNAPGDLFTTREYADFELEVTYKLHWPANTGIWFRYQNPEKAYQADILEWPDPKAFSGTIYCPGRMFLAINGDPNLEKKDDWNTMRIRAVGDRLQVWLNGTQTADVHDDAICSGRIGIQVHPGDQFAGMKVMIREMKIKEVPMAQGNG